MAKYLVSYRSKYSNADITNCLVEWDAISVENIRNFEYGFIVSITKLEEQNKEGNIVIHRLFGEGDIKCQFVYFGSEIAVYYGDTIEEAKNMKHENKVFTSDIDYIEYKS